MLLKSVEYSNFRPFKGIQCIDFTRPSGKGDSNVIVILGNNTFGKSTIILSFVWCFYGLSKFNRSKEILNKDIENNLKENEHATAQVKVVFEDEGIEYTIRRSQSFVMTRSGIKENTSKMAMTYIDKNGETQNCGQSEYEYLQAINAILPKELSSFFFFEGEKYNNLSSRYLGDSVKGLLGLEAMAKMKEHLHGNTKNPSSASVLGYYESKQVNKDDEKANEYNNKKISSEEELDKVKNRISEIDNQIYLYKNKINEINEILRTAAPTEQLQKQRDETKELLDVEKETLKNNYKRFINDFNNDSISLFTYPLFEKARNLLKQMNLLDKGIKGLEITTIKELLKRCECLCGTDLKEGTSAYKNVIKYIEILPPKEVGSYVRQLLDNIDDHDNKIPDFINVINLDYEAVQYSIQKINEYERKQVELLDKLKECDPINSAQYHKDILEYGKRVESLGIERDNLIRKEENLLSNIETCSNNLNMLKEKNHKTQIYELYYQYAKDMYDWVSETYYEKEIELRKRLEILVKEMFDNMYTGNRDVSIDDNYNIKITVDGRELDDTGGLRILQYFSFVGGLVKLASQVMSERNENEILGEDYPLVLDAAFSHADEVHVQTISKELSNSTKQLVLAVMSKDWKYASNAIEDKVGRIYELEKMSETYVIIKEVK